MIPLLATLPKWAAFLVNILITGFLATKPEYQPLAAGLGLGVVTQALTSALHK